MAPITRSNSRSFCSWPRRFSGCEQNQIGRLEEYVLAALYCHERLAFLTLLIGKGPNDVKRWIAIGSFQFQSSEVAKILIAVCFGVFYAKREEIIRQPKVFAGALLVALPPLLLIFKQPHLGARFLSSS
ncbi:MAG: FtsW/RodA/SpoVE family cell cycle protein [Fimbriimonadaceae bacterium]